MGKFDTSDRIWDLEKAVDDLSKITFLHQITLRDFFAGCALMGMLANPDDIDDALVAIPHDAYNYADAMLKAREE